MWLCCWIQTSERRSILWRFVGILPFVCFRWIFKWALLIACRPSVCKLSHFRLFLQTYLLNFSQTRHITPFGKGPPASTGEGYTEKKMEIHCHLIIFFSRITGPISTNVSWGILKNWGFMYVQIKDHAHRHKISKENIKKIC